MSTASAGRRRSTSRSSPAKTRRARGSTFSASVRPTTEISELCATASKPAARISSPPRPKAARSGTRRRSSEISRAPCRSPEASPATTSSAGGVTMRCPRDAPASRDGRGRPRRERIHQPGHQQAAADHSQKDLEKQLDLLAAPAPPEEREEQADQQRVEHHQQEMAQHGSAHSFLPRTISQASS